MGRGCVDGRVGHLLAAAAAVAVCLGLLPTIVLGGGAVLVPAAVAPRAAVEEPLPAALVARVLAVVFIITIVATTGAPCSEG